MTFIPVDQTDKEKVPCKPRPIDIETIAKLNQENRLLLNSYRELEEAYKALNENFNHLSETGEAPELTIRFQEKCEENKKLTIQNDKLQACIKKQKSVVEAHRQLEELLEQKENENKTLRETTSKLSYQINELNASLSKQSESAAATADYPRIVAELTQKFQGLYETMQEQAKEAEIQADENNKLKLENESLNEELENLRKLHIELTEKFEKCEKVIKDLNKKIEDCDNRKDEFTHMFNEHRTLKLKYEKLRAKYSSLEDESNTIDGKEIATEYVKVLSVNKELGGRVTTLADEMESIRRLSDGLRRRNENLENETRMLKEELLVAHAALQATKRHSTESCHTSVELVKQIKSLQRSLQVFTSVKGADFTINKEASMKLLREYDDYSIVDGQFPKLLLSCVLQRKVLELIFDYTNDFFKGTISSFDKVNNGNRSRIALTHHLVNLTNNVSVVQAGGDIDPSKIRDVNYDSLRSHIFENVKPLVDKILSVMNDCRSIKSSRKSRLYEEVINLVFNAISLYAFPTNSQRPMLEFVFFDSGTLFDEQKMEGACGDDISSDRAEIAVCYFPLVKSPNSDVVFSKAEVRMREISITTN
ncbi:751_t:CDS:1 [Paraglomus brasilianum]|uniref:751_t:CDS:1 n=1 Tax=Paraglomus brasilianum TaxID=144538 RepID=A0A9N9CTY8_9GLOM|nr:751_t:CDS:1 [Paraglomus brasilianum]